MFASASSKGTFVTFTVTLPVTLGLLIISILASSAKFISTVSIGESIQLYVIGVRRHCCAFFAIFCSPPAETCLSPIARGETDNKIIKNVRTRC